MNVLVPLQTSGRGEEALEPAADLAKWNGGKVTVLVANDSRGERSLSEFASAERISSGQALDRYMRQIERHLAERSVDLEVVSTPNDSAVEGAVEYAKEHDEVTAIAITEPRRLSISERVLGSPADKIVRNASIPVYVIPEAA